MSFSLPDRRGWQIIGIVALSALILFLRKPDALLHPQFFAEDGKFFGDAYDIGPRAIILPYAGYLHLLPRVIAWASVHVDPAWSPALYNISALALELLVVAGLFSPRFKVPAKAALALALVLIPHTGEVIVNVTNLQWVVALGLIVVAASEDAATSRQRAADWITLFVCGLTGPFSLFLLPVFVARTWIRRTKESAILLGMDAVAAAVQASFFIPFVRAEEPSPRHPVMLFGVLGRRIYGTFMAGYSHAPEWTIPVWIALGALATWILSRTILRRDVWSSALGCLVAAFVCVVAAVGVKFLRDTDVLLATVNGDRYFFLPHVLLAWMIVIVAARAGGWQRIAAVGLLAVALCANFTGLRSPALIDYGWAKQVQPIREGKAFKILINPDPWDINSDGRNSRR